MAAPLIPQEIYLIERYSAVVYFEQLKNAFAAFVDAVERALKAYGAHLPADYPDATGYEKILHHEAKGKQFINADGEPVVAFDKGYGLAQLTKPIPTYEQVWNWKENVKGGLKLYHAKRNEAKSYLSSHGKNSFTDEQLQLETF